MRSGLALAARMGALGALTVIVALLHHGHIAIFLSSVAATIAQRLPNRFRKHRIRVEPSLLQLYFDTPTIHYEVWVQRKPRSIEIGLHFEADRAENERWAQVLAARGPEVLAKLGPGAELEEWTRKWTRLHETHAVAGEEWRPKRDLTPELAREVAERLVRYVEVLQPVLDQERGAVDPRGERPALR